MMQRITSIIKNRYIRVLTKSLKRKLKNDNALSTLILNISAKNYHQSSKKNQFNVKFFLLNQLRNHKSLSAARINLGLVKNYILRNSGISPEFRGFNSRNLRQFLGLDPWVLSQFKGINPIIYFYKNMIYKIIKNKIVKFLLNNTKPATITRRLYDSRKYKLDAMDKIKTFSGSNIFSLSKPRVLNSLFKYSIFLKLIPFWLLFLYSKSYKYSFALLANYWKITVISIVKKIFSLPHYIIFFIKAAKAFFITSQISFKHRASILYYKHWPNFFRAAPLAFFPLIKKSSKISIKRPVWKALVKTTHIWMKPKTWLRKTKLYGKKLFNKPRVLSIGLLDSNFYKKNKTVSLLTNLQAKPHIVGDQRFSVGNKWHFKALGVNFKVKSKPNIYRKNVL